MSNGGADMSELSIPKLDNSVSSVSDDVKTPELDKIAEVKDYSQVCGDFLEFLKSKFDMFDRSVARSEPFYMRGTSDYINTEKLLAEFFGVDLNTAERERQAILQGFTNRLNGIKNTEE